MPTLGDLSSLVDPQAAGVFASICCLAWIASKLWARSRLYHIPVAPNSSWIWGNEKDVFFSPVGIMYSCWFSQRGRIYRIKGALTKPDVLVIGDPVALAYILQKRAYHYPHSPVTQNRIARILGKSLGWVEGQSEHRRMRALVAPALTLESVRDGSDDIHAAVENLESRLLEHVAITGGASTINIMQWVSTVTLDIIGRYGFSHDFGGGVDLDAQDVLDTWRNMSTASTSQKGWNAIMTFRLFPFIDLLPLRAIKAQASVRERLHEGIAKELARRAVPDFKSSKSDLLSRLLYAYDENQIPEDELIAHIAFFIMAGFETSAQVISFAVWQLSRHPELQQQLRDEINSIPNPTFDDYSTGMPILDAVIKESLRLSPSVPYVERVADEDDVIPLSEPILSTYGARLTEITIKKGQTIQLPYIAINRLGWEDGDAFRPARWLDANAQPPPGQLPRGWSGTLAFGDGPRNCVGFRLALFESRVIIASLVRRFVFDDADETITFKTAASIQAYVLGRESEGPQLPVKVRLV